MPKKNNSISYKNGKTVILDEDDSPEWTSDMFKKAKRGKKALEEIFGKDGAEKLIAKKVGRPKSDNPKQIISFRFSPKLVKHLQNKVSGYNRRVESLLLQAMQEGKI